MDQRQVVVKNLFMKLILSIPLLVSAKTIDMVIQTKKY